MKRAWSRPAAAAALAVAIAMAGCSTVGELGAAVGVASGKLTVEQAEAIRKTSQAVEKSFEDITPEQEYYIGRTVAAVILDQYRPYHVPQVSDYLNVMGRSLSLVSDRPETFGGYHFLALDTDEINAFAAPGGFIFVSRGLLRCAAGEDEVAAILAHEISHVTAKHGLQAIKKSRLTTALTSAALTGAQLAAPEETAKLFAAFEDSITDITTTLINKGYSREAELEADRLAIAILERSGYDPQALVRMLQVMSTRLKPGGPDFAKTHPDPKDRIKVLGRPPVTPAAAAAAAARNRRFRAALGGI